MVDLASRSRAMPVERRAVIAVLIAVALWSGTSLFVRAEDIPSLVADGAADAGITGWDLVLESGRERELLLDLGFGRSRLAVAMR